MKQAIGKIVEGETDIMKTIGETFKDIIEIATTRGFMGGHELIICAPDLLVEFDVGCAAQAPALRVLVKNAADEEGIISDVRAQEKTLLGRRAGECDQHVGNVFVRAIIDLVRRL